MGKISKKFMKNISDFVEEDAGIDINAPFPNDIKTDNITIDTLPDFNEPKKEDDLVERLVLKKKYEAMYEAYKAAENNVELYNSSWTNDTTKNKIDMLKKICSVNVDINDKIAGAISKGVSFFIEKVISNLFIDIKGFSTSFLAITEVKEIIKQLSVEYLMNITIVNNKMRLVIIACMTAFQTAMKNKMSNALTATLSNLRAPKDKVINNNNIVDDESNNTNNIIIEDKKDEK